MRSLVLIFGLTIASLFGGVESRGGEYGTVEGNSPLLPQPPVYTVLFLPANYQNDSVSQDLLNGFNQNPTLVALKNKSEYVVYTSDNPDFNNRFAPLMQPMVSSGKPGVLVVNNGTKLLYQYGVGSKQIASEVKGKHVLDQIANCHPFKPNQPTTPPVAPVVQPTNPITPTAPVTPTPDATEANTGVVVGVLALAAIGVWMIAFRIRM